MYLIQQTMRKNGTQMYKTMHNSKDQKENWQLYFEMACYYDNCQTVSVANGVVNISKFEH